MKKFVRLGEKLFNISICGHDIQEYSIVLHNNGNLKSPAFPRPEIEKATAVLQNYIAKLTDVVLPILHDTNPLKTKYEIIVGSTEREIDETKTQKFADEEYVLYTKDGNVIINGGARGILYAVYDFLEKYFGVRFFTKDFERVLNCDTIKIEEIHEHFLPVFEYREISDWTAWNADFSVKSKINGTFIRNLRPEDGEGVGFAGGFEGLVHTIGWLVPPHKYYKSNPEFYALQENGERNPGGLCFHSDGAFKVLLKNVKAWLNAERNPTIVSVSVNDGNAAYCRCEKCKKVLQKGNDTDLLMLFVNKVARAVRKEYPNISVETISYAQVADTPKFVKPEPNVAIQVCAEGCRKLSLPDAIAEYEKTGNKNLVYNYKFAKRLETLAKVTSKIYVWDYPYDYNVLNAPFPVLHTLLGTSRYYADHNVKGIFINGNVDSCEFTELKVYLLAKSMYNPYMTEAEYELCMDEFLEAYYGRGWKYIKKYIQLLEKKCDYFFIDATPAEVVPDKRNKEKKLDKTFVNKARELFAKAYSLANGPGEQRRVRKTALHVDYMELYSYMEEAMKTATEEERAEWVQKNREWYESCKQLGVTRVQENTFIPVATNFEQPPTEFSFWDHSCVVGDRNNERYARDLYVLIPLTQKMGESVDCSFLYKTNNENPDGMLGVDCEGVIVYSTINPTWKQYREDVRVELRGGKVTNVEEFSLKTGIPLNDVRLNLIPRHLRGLILRIKSMNAGAYMTLKDVKIL